MTRNKILLGGVLAISVIAILLTLLITKPWQTGLTVNGASMEPTLKHGDKVRLQKDSKDMIRRGDLVAIKFKTRERPMLKRVIALEGDKVEFIDGRLKLNDEWLTTVWWPADKRIAPRHYKLLALQLSRYDNHIPRGNLIVMGDNTNQSFDSGDYGMISTNQVMGQITSK